MVRVILALTLCGCGMAMDGAERGDADSDSDVDSDTDSDIDSDISPLPAWRAPA